MTTLWCISKSKRWPIFIFSEIAIGQPNQVDLPNNYMSGLV